MANGNTGSFVSFPNAVIEGSRFSTDFCAASYLKNHEHDERERCILTHNLPIFGLQLVRARWATNKLAENLFTTTTCLLTSYSNLSLSLSVLTICNLRAFTAFSDARLQSSKAAFYPKRKFPGFSFYYGEVQKRSPGTFIAGLSSRNFSPSAESCRAQTCCQKSYR